MKLQSEVKLSLGIKTNSLALHSRWHYATTKDNVWKNMSKINFVEKTIIYIKL
jgi:hypothetical protein